jgi:predicted metal-dependent hydrolase
VRFPFGEESAARKYFANDDMVFSHFTANLSAGFPPGEEAFIRSVRHYSDQITDPVLKKRVAGFIGQEAMHGQEHRRINDKLTELGYRIDWWDSDKFEQRRLKFEKRIGPRVHLAMTAAAEHYTAVLAERAMRSPEVEALLTDPHIKNLFYWHAYEELEHKSVAFDVYRTVGGPEWIRIVVMAAMLTFTFPFTVITLLLSLADDPVARRHPLRIMREARNLFLGPIFKGMIGDLAKYMRPGFHPDDVETTELLAQWQKKLFNSEEGMLVGYVK